MRHKKPEESEKPAEEKALEERVDAMMDTHRSSDDPTTAVPAPVGKKSSLLTEAPAKEQPSAPLLTGRLLKQIPVDDETFETDPSKPYQILTSNLSIDKLDELTESMTDDETPSESVVPTPPEPATEPGKEDNAEMRTDLDDPVTDKAVDDIVAKEGDMVLAAEDAKAAHQAKPKSPGRKDKVLLLLKNKWTWLGILVVLGIILGVPATRYKLLGLVIKKSISITLLDSKTASPVNNAEVQLAGSTAKTDGNGMAHLRVRLGPGTLVIKKQYYRNFQTSFFTGFKVPSQPARIKLLATGRLVPVTILNKVTGSPVNGAEIKVLDTAARTNFKGQAIIALPANATKYTAKLSLAGYNPAEVSVQIVDSVVKANNFELTPAGHIYFLSNLHGNVDVVRANLDGTGRKTILEGTGHEDPNTTSLLASRDWRYLVLKARREASTQSALYLIDTSSDKVTQFDSGDASFNLVGWYGHSFVYDLSRNNLSNWQSNRQILKSYNADNMQLNQLDQNKAEGSAGAHAYQNFYNFYIVNGALVYNTQWYTYTASGFNYDLSGKTDTIRAIQPDGQNKKDYQSFPAGVNDYIQAVLYGPNAAYYAVHENSSNKINYYEFEDQAVKTADIDSSAFTKTYPTYLFSPTGNKTFWTELRDGKNTLFTGDSSAKSEKQVTGLSSYSPYGWYSDRYLLVSKNSSELYIMPSGSLLPARQPLKITNYYKPAQTYNGYGYGYGGL